jgi:hypothetical protein
MRGLRTVAVLLAVAFALRFWLHPTVGIHFTRWVVRLNVVGFGSCCYWRAPYLSGY